MKQYKVGIIGGTGMVGQRFVTLMEKHPWFQLTVIAASPRSAGRFCPLRHFMTSKGTWEYVCRISLVVAHLAVPCWPSPTVLDLIPLRV